MLSSFLFMYSCIVCRGGGASLAQSEQILLVPLLGHVLSQCEDAKHQPKYWVLQKGIHGSSFISSALLSRRTLFEEGEVQPLVRIWTDMRLKCNMSI